MQLPRQSLAHGTARRRFAAHTPAPARPAAATIPSAVAGPKAPLPRRSSDRSTVPSTALLVTVPPSTVDVDEAVLLDGTVVFTTEVDVLTGVASVELDTDVAAGAATVTIVAGIAGAAAVAVGPCDATPAEVGSGAVG